VADTFGQVWKELLVFAPGVPPTMAQKAVRDAYRRVVERYDWSGLRAESAMVIPTAYTTGTVAVTQGSATVTGTSTVWTSAMIGRQFIEGGQAPFYTIATFVSATQITLDRPYQGATKAAATYEITVAYLTAPTDLLRLDSVLDPDNFWRLRLNVTQESIDMWDAKRAYSSAGASPRILAAAPYSSSGVPRFEIWPRTTAAKTYYIRYLKRPADLSADSDTLAFPIRGDVLRYGALSYLSMWPGVSKDAPNMIYNVGSHREFESLFQQELGFLERRDQDINLDSLWYDDWTGAPWAPIDSSFLQSHAF